MSQNSITEQTDEAGDTSEFIVTSNKQSLEEIPAMDEQDTDMQYEQSIEAEDIGLNGQDTAAIEDLHESITIQEEVPAV